MSKALWCELMQQNKTWGIGGILGVCYLQKMSRDSSQKMTPKEKIIQARARKSRREEKRAENEALNASKSLNIDQGCERTPYFVVEGQKGYSLTKRGKESLSLKKEPWYTKPNAISPIKKKCKTRKIKRGALKSQIVRLLGLIDRKINGPICRFHKDHQGDTSCHIVPQSRGDAARFEPDNVYWGCRAANYGEFRHRSLYRQYHIDIFGKETVERLEEIAKGFKQYSHKELMVLRDKLKLNLLN